MNPFHGTVLRLKIISFYRGFKDAHILTIILGGQVEGGCVYEKLWCSQNVKWIGDYNFYASLITAWLGKNVVVVGGLIRFFSLGWMGRMAYKKSWCSMGGSQRVCYDIYNKLDISYSVSSSHFFSSKDTFYLNLFCFSA